MSAIEETLLRISQMSGVDGYVIVDVKGTILRQSKSLTTSEAMTYAAELLRLSQKARHVVRDLDPKNDLDVFRLRGKDKEILVAPGPANAFLVIVIQRWAPTAVDEYSLPVPGGATTAAAAGAGAGGAATVAVPAATGAAK